jgi:hypothetical protein
LRQRACFADSAFIPFDSPLLSRRAYARLFLPSAHLFPHHRQQHRARRAALLAPATTREPHARHRLPPAHRCSSSTARTAACTRSGTFGLAYRSPAALLPDRDAPRAAGPQPILRLAATSQTFKAAPCSALRFMSLSGPSSHQLEISCRLCFVSFDGGHPSSRCPHDSVPPDTHMNGVAETLVPAHAYVSNRNEGRARGFVLSLDVRSVGRAYNTTARGWRLAAMRRSERELALCT